MSTTSTNPTLGSRLPLSEKNANFAPAMPQDQTSNLTQKVAAFIAANQLAPPSSKLIVGLSGGADSVALLAALVHLGYDCVAAHCNYHLRAHESNRDMLHASSVAKQLGVDFVVKHFNVPARRAETGESLEMACRELRYQWFEQLVASHHAHALAVGHHAEDSVETVLLNLLRGTGINGLRGIAPKRDFIIRPLLSCTRPEIELFLNEQKLTFITDSSNASNAHLRNRLRNHIIPLIISHFPSAQESILSSAANVSAAAALFNSVIHSHRAKFTNQKGQILVAQLVNEHPAHALTILREILAPLGFSASQCRDIVAAPLRSGLTFHSSSGKSFSLDRGILTPMQPVEPNHQIPVSLHRHILSPLHITVTLHTPAQFSRLTNSNSIIFDAALALSPSNHWCLRHWRRGDRITPFGHGGSKLVSDIFSDAKLSSAQKKAAWLLTCNGKIAWVIGLRNSSMFPVTPQTKKFIKLSLNNS